MAARPAIRIGGEPDPTDERARQAATTIGRWVMAALGRPTHFRRITVRRVTDEGHRVNVIAGPDEASAWIVDSFFVTADADGNVTNSSPTIVKRY